MQFFVDENSQASRENVHDYHQNIEMHHIPAVLVVLIFLVFSLLAVFQDVHHVSDDVEEKDDLETHSNMENSPPRSRSRLLSSG